MLKIHSVLGAVNHDIDFSYELNFVGGCGVTLRDKFWYLGGLNPYKRQVSFKVINSNTNVLF